MKELTNGGSAPNVTLPSLSGPIEAAIRSRRSVRAFRPQMVDPTLLEHLIAGAGWAPSPHNAQPWRFVVVTTDGSKRDLAEAMGERFRADLLADGLSEASVTARVRASVERLTRTPALIIVCMVEDGLDAYPDVMRRVAERTMAMQSIGAAVQNLLLVADSLGLGACWLCAPLFCPETVSETLALDSAWEPQALVLVGYPSKRPAVAQRKPSASLTVYR